MKSTAQLAAAAALLGAAEAFWRMPCMPAGLARLDPLVNPGEVSPHSHTIHGGNNFHMDTTCDDLLESQCTSCKVTQDKSAYWTPALYFIHEDGTSEIVPQIGGMLAYYHLYHSPGQKVEAFPKGFQMLAGDSRNRNFSLSFPDMDKTEWKNHPEETTQENLALKGLGFNCLNYAVKPAEPSMYRHFLPDKNYMDQHCPQGIRAEIFFPSCWNGEIDSPNHKDHMAYPDTTNDGNCPKSHPRRVPSLFYETIWFTNKFNGVPGQFMFSNGDPTGYGYHADFITGWEPEFLQQAIDTCTNDSGEIGDCDLFDIQSDADAAKCAFDVPEVLKSENCAGPADGICGNPAIYAGPEYAPAPKNGGKVPEQTAVYPTTPAPVPTLSYKPAEPSSDGGYGYGTPVKNKGVSKEDPAPAAPATTPAAKLENQSIGGQRVLSTSTYTSAGVVHEVVIVEQDVYVTVDAPQKRHLIHPMRRDTEHGLLGHRHFH